MLSVTEFLHGEIMIDSLPNLRCYLTFLTCLSLKLRYCLSCLPAWPYLTLDSLTSEASLGPESVM